jgi:hypothetical protein
MTDRIQPANSNGHGGYERRDIRTSDVVYFLAALAFSMLIVYFVVTGVYRVLEKRSQEQQAPVSPLVKNVPEDTRHLPPEYKTDSDSTGYEKYLKKNFPAPQLETDERTQLNSVISKQEEELNSYGYIDEKAGTLHIPIERAMDLIAQRGLPVRGQSASAGAAAASAPAEKIPDNKTSKKKGSKQ